VILGLVVAAAIVLAIRRAALISAGQAARYLKEGAVIVDVRNPDEFQQRHVPGAINLPLSGLPGSLQRQIPDKQQTILLHCLGGGRSAVAQRLLRANGYRRAYNLGSLSRAEHIARAGRENASTSPASDL